MSESYLISNVTVVNEGEKFIGSIGVSNGKIERIYTTTTPSAKAYDKIIDGTGKHLFPGIIDDHVHFREPGLTHKADINTESKAAIAGGITSFMEMPNTIPQATTQKLLEEKYTLAADKSLANYSFYLGATNDNISEVLKTDPTKVCGIKLFMGSSTGNMLVDNTTSLENIFSQCPMLIAVHCEDEKTIQKNTKLAKEKYGDTPPFSVHQEIRSTEACYISSSLAIKTAKKYNSRLHLLHLTTAKELELLDNSVPLKEKRITGEACVHHLWFSDKDYHEKQWRIKWNPAIKTTADRDGLIEGVLSNKIDVIATDHAPHLETEKQKTYFEAPSGGPSIQHSLVAMLDLYHNNKISLEKIVEKMCHAPADCFSIKNRGFIREGYNADLVLIDLEKSWRVEKGNILSKCNWSPFEGHTFKSSITHTFVNGHLVYKNGIFNEEKKGDRLMFNR
ncbi:MAG: dihydroorotase [Bacteroidota bacterium]|nr:dihydroorotase [Bacteroidota bacterium]